MSAVYKLYTLTTTFSNGPPEAHPEIYMNIIFNTLRPHLSFKQDKYNQDLIRIPYNYTLFASASVYLVGGGRFNNR